MSDYKHRMSLAVPEQYMNEANNLALIAGLSEADINTFTVANWQDKDGNLYSVCSTSIKPVVLGMFGISLTDITLPVHASHADVIAAQQALDKVVMYKQGDKASTTSIMCVIDFEPLAAFADMGLSIIDNDLLDELN